MDETEARIARLEHDVRVIKEQGATKVDLAELKAELIGKLAVVKADILVRLAEVESGLRTEMAASVGGLRTEMAASVGGLRTEMAASISSLRTDIEVANGRLFRWVVVVVLLGQLAPALLKHFGAT